MEKQNILQSYYAMNSDLNLITLFCYAQLSNTTKLGIDAALLKMMSIFCFLSK